jgi:cold shock CspA family protein
VARPDDDDDEPKKKFRIERKRLGKIISIMEEKNFGFIEAEDYRDDVFFHFQDWEGEVIRNGRTFQILPEPMQWVEFELDDERFEKEQKLRAKAVRPTERPIGRKLSGRDATFKLVTHHPNAKRKKPNWRK